MNQPNPYDSGSGIEQSDIDAKQMQAVAVHLAAARSNPPTIASTLLKASGTPLLVVAGILGTGILLYLTREGIPPMTSHWPLGLAAMVFGAVLRDVGLAKRVKKSWPAQSHFIDWKKVEEFRR